jgi:uncharacterized protein
MKPERRGPNAARTPKASLIFALAIAVAVAATEAQPIVAPRPSTARILLVTGIDYPGHLWRQTAPALRDLVAKDPRLTVRVVEDPDFLDSTAITNYAAIILHWMNWHAPGPGPAARRNLRRFVENGGGLVLTHFACGAWYGEWPQFKDIVGRVWFGPDGGRQHDPHGRFTVEIADRRHPIMEGMTNFETDDELYTCLTGNAPIHLLARARSKVDGKEYPMAFVRECGRGRVFLTTLGHDVGALTNRPVAELLRRGCAWAAGLEPTPPNHPGK